MVSGVWLLVSLLLPEGRLRILSILWPELGTYVHICMRASKGSSGPGPVAVPGDCVQLRQS